MRTTIRQKKDLTTGTKRGNKKPALSMHKNNIIELSTLLNEHGYLLYAFKQNALDGSIELEVRPA